jgi:hypothetical protein
MGENALEAQEAEAPEGKPGFGFVALSSLTGIIITLIRTFGWPGTLLVLGFYFVNSHATAEQKQSIISIYILGEGISQRWPILVVSVVFILVLFAQRKWHDHDTQKLRDSLDDLKKRNQSLRQRLKKKGPPSGGTPRRGR